MGTPALAGTSSARQQHGQGARRGILRDHLISTGLEYVYEGTTIATIAQKPQSLHHLPVGDNYIYNPGLGHGVRLPQPGGKTAVFDWDRVRFLENDHMTGPSSLALSAPAAHQILEFWERNPMQRRTMQWGDAYGPTTHIYGNFFYDTLTIRITGLAAAGVTDCEFAREEEVADTPPEIEIDVNISGERQSLSYSGGTCKLTLSAAQQEAAFPGVYVLLQRDDVWFPVYIGRNVVETLYWADGSTSSGTFELQATAGLEEAMDAMAADLASGSGPVIMSTTMVANALLPWESADGYPIVGALDGLGNQYAIEFR